MTILYIDNEHCSSVEQLKGYFKTGTNYDSPIRMELLDYGRAGDISDWLREKGESELTDSVDNINNDFGDSDYFSQLTAIITGERGTTEKPEFQKCLHVENVISQKDDNGIIVCVLLKILSSVNESYEFAVRTNWGTKTSIINPYDLDEGSTAKMEFKFRKCQNSTINEIALFVDEKEVYFKNGILLGQDMVEFTVGNCTFSMINIVDKNNETDDGNNSHSQSVKEFYIGQTTVTQKLWKAVMGNNDQKISRLVYKSSGCGWRSAFGEHTKKLIGDNKPMVGITYEDCLEFIKKLNNITGKFFRLPTDREWLFAANGASVEKDRKTANLQKSAWLAKNSKKELHNVSQKAPNQFGLYDMYGNVWERVLDRGIKRGGSYATLDYYGTWSPVQCEKDDEECDNDNTGFRLLLVNNEHNDSNEEYVDLGLSVLWSRNWICSFNVISKVLPTKDLAEELLKKCNSEKIGNSIYKIIGPNGNYIYVPNFWLMLSGNGFGNKEQALSFRYSEVNSVYLNNIHGSLLIKSK